MNDGTKRAGETSTLAAARRDRGTTFIEILIAVVLLGTLVIGVLTAMRTTIHATQISRDHAKAQQWLQSAVGALQAFEPGPCSLYADAAAFQPEYQTAVETTEVPAGWEGGTISVSVPKVWDGVTFVDSAASTCFLSVNEMRQQLVTISVESPDHKIKEEVEVVKRA